MAEPASLNDFFKKSAKKKIKGSNLNTQPSAKAEVKKAKAKDAEEEQWAAEEEVVATGGLKVEAAGKLPRDDEKKEEEDAGTMKWGRTNKADTSKHSAELNERRFPSLAKSVATSSVGNSNIMMEDGQSGQVNITTHKNVFSALENDDADDDDGGKRSGKIMPAMVQKKKGETSKAAIEREVQKYKKDVKEDKKKAAKADKDDDEDDDEDSSEEEEEEKPEEKPVEEVKKKKEEKKVEKKVKAPEPKPQEETADDEDTRIQPDLEACKEKYEKRRKLPYKQLPKSEMEEEKENKPKQQIGGKKKKGFIDEEEENGKKLMAAPAGW